MEPRFFIQRNHQKQEYIEFSKFLYQYPLKRRRWLSGLSLCILLVFGVYAAYWDTPVYSIVLLLFGVACVFSDQIEGLRAYRLKQRNVGTVELYFYDDHLQTRSRQYDDTFFYTGIVDFLETKHLFLLMVSKTLYIIVPKSSLPAEQHDTFRDFIAQQTGHTCRVCPLRLIWSWCSGAACCIALGISLAFTFFLPVTYTLDDYSISLPQGFEEYLMTSAEDEFTAFFSDDTAVLLAPFDGNTLEYVYRYTGGTIKLSPALLHNAEESAAIYLDNGVLYFTKTYSDLGIYNCYAVGTKADGDEFVTVFVCRSKLRAEYESLFLKWAETIQFSPQN